VNIMEAKFLPCPELAGDIALSPETFLPRFMRNCGGVLVKCI
jgi:hypothetical protein